MTKHDHTQWAQIYAETHNLHETARMVGVTPSAVYRALRDLGVDTSHPTPTSLKGVVKCPHDDCIDRVREICGVCYRHWRYELNHDKTIEQRRQWRRANPESYAVEQSKHRAHRRVAKRLLRTGEWQQILETYYHACAYCGSIDKKLSIDHVIPRSLGGDTVASNIVPACISCNSKKQARTDWIPMTPERIAHLLGT
jgi:5-methylcytosine-specific restriction endonuclease McrA